MVDKFKCLEISVSILDCALKTGEIPLELSAILESYEIIYKKVTDLASDPGND